ncbi:hypothetical protein VC83_04776 [Pseudogymnoascus destructans]|uniref:Uncharacterized protein n=1 Tax=Pseudogymnoascus destructans TaxID=655981 RepID=A0A177A8L4_9PEZI|nr:uncharacterized protein VC83_04776 [Pseudogymnoascus destructans]OAF57374.1 hypothetical protein VC83_04776 [Pseudogymnoascus destructans]
MADPKPQNPITSLNPAKPLPYDEESQLPTPLPVRATIKTKLSAVWHQISARGTIKLLLSLSIITFSVCIVAF